MLFMPSQRERHLKMLEQQQRDARSEYQDACRELIRRADGGRRGDSLVTAAANFCAAKKRAYDLSSTRLRVARDGR